MSLNLKWVSIYSTFIKNVDIFISSIFTYNLNFVQLTYFSNAAGRSFSRYNASQVCADDVFRGQEWMTQGSKF